MLAAGLVWREWRLSEADRRRWEERWRTRSHDLGTPEPFLLRLLPQLPRGRVLDVAAGAGRHAIFLAARGFAVTAVDIAEAALQLLAERARAAGVMVTTRRVDLDEPTALHGLGPFDLLLVVRYRPAPAQWRRLLAPLAPTGAVLVCTFGEEDHRRHGTRREHCISRAELEAALAPARRPVVYEVFEESGRMLEGSLWLPAPLVPAGHGR